MNIPPSSSLSAQSPNLHPISPLSLYPIHPWGISFIINENLTFQPNDLILFTITLFYFILYEYNPTQPKPNRGVSLHHASIIFSPIWFFQDSGSWFYLFYFFFGGEGGVSVFPVSVSHVSSFLDFSLGRTAILLLHHLALQLDYPTLPYTNLLCGFFFSFFFFFLHPLDFPGRTFLCFFGQVWEAIFVCYFRQWGWGGLEYIGHTWELGGGIYLWSFIMNCYVWSLGRRGLPSSPSFFFSENKGPHPGKVGAVREGR